MADAAKPETKKKSHPILSGFLYVLLVLVIAGGAGIWLPLVIPDRHLGMDAVVSFVMAALTPIGADLVLRNAPGVTTQFQRLLVLVICTIAAIFALIAFFREKNTPYCWWFAGVSILISIGIWLYLYVQDPMFEEPPEPAPPGAGVNNPEELLGAGV